MSKTIIFCMVCGMQDEKHKSGCAPYTGMLKSMFGSNVKALFEASDRRLLPTPPWELIKLNAKPMSGVLHPWEVEARELRAAGWKFVDIAEHLTSQGYTTPKGNRITDTVILKRIDYLKKRTRGTV